jgi:hypothetical protein
MKENNIIANNNLFYILSLFGYLFLVSMLTMFYFHERDMSNYLHYTNCYHPISDYSVEPGKSSTSILNECGGNKNERCCRNASSLSDAIYFAQNNKAEKFMYHEGTKNTCLLDPRKTTYKNNPQSAIYSQTRMFINQDNSGNITKDVKTNFNTSVNENKSIELASVYPNHFSYATTAT